MKRLATVWFFAMALTACARLDDNLFEPTQVTEYVLDDYKGPLQFQVDASFDIAANRIHPIELRSDDGKEVAILKAFYVGDLNAIATDTVILYCHGNTDHMDYYWPRAKLLANAGGKNHFGVLMLDYRGYGLSQGTPSEQGLYADVDAAMVWLAAQGLTGDRLVIYGYSLGTAPAVELSANPRTLVPSKVILESPFASAEVMVQDAALLALPGSYVTDLKIDNAETIKHVSQRLLWLHGTNDTFVNIKTHGEVVYRNHPGTEGVDKFPIRVTGATHRDIPVVLGFQAYSDRIADFIE